MLRAVTQPPPPLPPPGPPPTPGPYYGAPLPAAERVRAAWQRRNETDYVFDFWTAFGWTLLSCGIYGFYVLYQLIRRSREHNLRRLEVLDAAATFAWEQAEARGVGEELRPNFERISAQMAVLRGMTSDFRDPALWVVIAIFASSIAQIVAYVLLDGDLVKHDYAEGAIEAELSAVYGRLGAAMASPDPTRLKGKHNYGGRIAASIFTCGIYSLWWLYDVMVEGNRHFEHNWRWEDSLAQGVQAILPTT